MFVQCLSNVKQAVDGHNKTKLSQTNTSDENTCNCRNKKRCPMNGKCLVKSPVYQATVTTDDNRPSQTYVGLTENTFKTRFNNHKASFNSYQKRNSAELSKYVWDLSGCLTKNHAVRFTLKIRFALYLYHELLLF